MASAGPTPGAVRRSGRGSGYAGRLPAMASSAGPRPATANSAGPRPATPNSAGPRPATANSPGPRPATANSPGPRPATANSPGPRPATANSPGPRPTTASSTPRLFSGPRGRCTRCTKQRASLLHRMYRLPSGRIAAPPEARLQHRKERDMSAVESVGGEGPESIQGDGCWPDDSEFRAAYLRAHPPEPAVRPFPHWLTPNSDATEFPRLLRHVRDHGFWCGTDLSAAGSPPPELAIAGSPPPEPAIAGSPPPELAVAGSPPPKPPITGSPPAVPPIAGSPGRRPQHPRPHPPDRDIQPSHRATPSAAPGRFASQDHAALWFSGCRNGNKVCGASRMAPWRSWLARRPVTAEVAGSSPVGVAKAVKPLWFTAFVLTGNSWHGQVAQLVAAFA